MAKLKVKSKAPDFKLKDSQPMDDLELNKEYIITHISKHCLKDTPRFYIKVKGSDRIFRANKFLEEHLQNNNNELLLRFKTLDLKYNKTIRHKEVNLRQIKTDKTNKIEDIILSR